MAPVANAFGSGADCLLMYAAYMLFIRISACEHTKFAKVVGYVLKYICPSQLHTCSAALALEQ